MSEPNPTFLRRTTSDELKLFIKERGVKVDCEVCGHNSWIIYTGDDNYLRLLSTYVAVIDDRGFVVGPEVMPFYVIGCQNCGNARQFAKHVVDEFLEKHSGQ